MVSPDWTDVSWWLLVLDGAGILAIWEIGSILTHRWHTVSWLSWRYPVLRYLILLAAGLFAAWWIQHASHPSTYLHVGAGASIGLWAILQWLERSEVARWWQLRNSESSRPVSK